MHTLKMYIVPALLAASLGCSQGPTHDAAISVPGETPTPTRDLDMTYSYRGVAGNGTIVGTLELHFDRPEASTLIPIQISGSWTLASEGQVGEVGPQVGKGDLVGRIDRDNRVSLELNPGWADNNVSLSGTLDPGAGSFSGTWSYSNFRGAVSSGSFAAEPR